MTRYSGKWALVSFLLAIPFAYSSWRAPFSVHGRI